MNRFKYAAGVLRHGIPEPEPIYVAGEPVTLYAVHLYDWQWYRELGPQKVNHRWHFFKSCEQAHSEFPGVEVTTTEAFKSGGRYFFNKHLREIEVEPKPKVAKGRRK